MHKLYVKVKCYVQCFGQNLESEFLINPETQTVRLVYDY